jgi:uncharacterized LabA/DUF88 family protein
MENPHVALLKRAVKGTILVLIDAANLERSVKEMGWQTSPSVATNQRYSVDYKKLKEFFTVLGVHKKIRYYTAHFGTKTHQRFCYFLERELLFRIILKPLKRFYDHTTSKMLLKANFDVEIAVDAMTLYPDFDTLILFSGDSDFECLIKRLRSKGKTVIGFSYKNNIARELPTALSYYFDISCFSDELLKIDPL